MSKLTLSVEESVVSRARGYAKQQGVSISAMVEAYLAAVADPPQRTARNSPILNSLRGTLKRADIGDYRRHLETKYR